MIEIECRMKIRNKSYMKKIRLDNLDTHNTHYPVNYSYSRHVCLIVKFIKVISWNILDLIFREIYGESDRFLRMKKAKRIMSRYIN